MTTGDVKRKLTAIFSADVEGYSRLMGEDELATIETLTSHKEIMRKLIRQYRGRVVDSTGDNLLAEFASVVDAVQCAVEVQQVLSAKNETLPENRRMSFRIGINLGDVVEEGERIYGDGVNVAARVESLAEGGGISISGTAYDQLGKKLPLGYQYLGEQTVKNIEKPVRVYRVLTEAEAVGKVIGEKRLKPMPWRLAAVAAVMLILVAGVFAVWHFYLRPDIEPASVEKMAFPLPDKPSIAVLPFVNMSEDPKQEYFSDGLTDQIINGLSKVPGLFVIARNSTFTYKGKPVKVQKIAEDLGVRYVLEGSVQKTADRIRITTQLIDATKGHHLWSERYDRDLEDIFAIQDDITMETMKAMRVELRGDQARMWVKHETTNLEAYEKFLEALSYWRRFTKRDNAQARQLFEEAIALDSQFAAAYALVGWTHFIEARFGWTESRVKSINMALKYAQKTLEMDDTIDYAHTLLSAVYLLKRQYEKAVAAAEHALTLNPNAARLYDTLGGVVGCSGRWEDSIVYTKKSIRLDPFPLITAFHWLGRAYFMTGQYDEAILTFKKALDLNPNYLFAHAFLAASYSSLGRETQAAAAAKEVLRINPKFSLVSYAKTLPYKNKSDVERYIAALRKAGLPETPPLPLPDKPSIAVLPFANMSGDPEQEYFSDGITEEIITALSKTPKLFVIARNSTFTYKGKPVKVQQVGRELGVKYVLEGSVRKAGNKVRITGQLVDAKTGNHLWAERYDRELKDIFAVQDEITKKITTAMQVELTEGEQARLWRKTTNNPEAYEKFLQALKYFRLGSPDGNVLSRQMAEKAIELDPEFAMAYVILGQTYKSDVVFGLSKSPKESLRRTYKLAQKAMTLDDSTKADAYALMGSVHLLKREHEKNIALKEQAVALNPNHADNTALLAIALTYGGRPEEGIRVFKKAIRLNPFPPAWYFNFLGIAYRLTGQYEESIATCNRATRLNPDQLFAHACLAAAYSLLGREEEARAEATEVLRIHPKFSLEKFGKMLPFKNKADIEGTVNALRKAGLK
jgi:adenylate cyclase